MIPLDDLDDLDEVGGEDIGVPVAEVFPASGPVRPCRHHGNDLRCEHGCAAARAQELGPPDSPTVLPQLYAEQDMHLPKPGDPTLSVFIRKGDPLPWPPSAPAPTAPSTTPASRRRRTASP